MGGGQGGWVPLVLEQIAQRQDSPAAAACERVMISGALPNRVAAVFTAAPALWRFRPRQSDAQLVPERRRAGF